MDSPFITTEVVSRISSLSKEKGLKVLAKHLGYTDKHLHHLRGSILLDFHYGNLMMAVDNGFSLLHAIKVLMLGMEMITESTGVPLCKAVEIFQKKILHLSNMIQQEKLKLFTDYFFETFMKHYRLYQFVLTQGQEPMASEFDVHVIPPVECEKLKEAKVLEVWEYEQKIEKLECEENERKTKLNEQKQKEESEKENEKQYQFGSNSLDLNREVISEMIKKASKAEAHHTEKLLQLEVDEKHEDLDFYLKKTALPRPAVLGAPPRTKAPPKLSAGGKPSKSAHKLGTESQPARASTRGSRGKPR